MLRGALGTPGGDRDGGHRPIAQQGAGEGKQVQHGGAAQASSEPAKEAFGGSACLSRAQRLCFGFLLFALRYPRPPEALRSCCCTGDA